MNLYLLCGLAFAGKTTLASILSRHARAEVVSLDEINASRGLHGGEGIPDEEWVRTHHEALRQVESTLAAGRPVVVDDTNCFRFLRDNYRAVAEAQGADTILLYIDRPLELLLDRIRENDESRSRASVRISILLDLARKFEPPGPDEDAVLVPDVPLEVWVDRQFARNG
jgi:predicted kinase